MIGVNRTSNADAQAKRQEVAWATLEQLRSSQYLNSNEHAELMMKDLPSQLHEHPALPWLPKA
eukprot:11166344-Lingulodinium_polyedra.AAC.1